MYTHIKRIQHQRKECNSVLLLPLTISRALLGCMSCDCCRTIPNSNAHTRLRLRLANKSTEPAHVPMVGDIAHARTALQRCLNAMLFKKSMTRVPLAYSMFGETLAALDKESHAYQLLRSLLKAMSAADSKQNLLLSRRSGCSSCKGMLCLDPTPRNLDRQILPHKKAQPHVLRRPPGRICEKP